MRDPFGVNPKPFGHGKAERIRSALALALAPLKGAAPLKEARQSLMGETTPFALSGRPTRPQWLPKTSLAHF